MTSSKSGDPPWGNNPCLGFALQGNSPNFLLFLHALCVLIGRLPGGRGPGARYRKRCRRRGIGRDAAQGERTDMRVHGMRRGAVTPRLRDRWAQVALALAAGAILVLGGADAARAQTSCSALLLPQPNLGQTPPGDVLEPGEVVTIDLFILNTCITGGVEVPAQIQGTTTVTLACADAEPCLVPLVGTFANVNCAPEVDVSCAVNPNNNEVLLTYTGAGNTKNLPAFPTFTKLATITAQAQPGGQPATPAGRFELDATTDPGDVFTAQASGSGSGSAPFFFPGACVVKLDRQISCDGGTTFFDVRDGDDPANTLVQSCAAATTDGVVVRHEIQNGGVADLLACSLVDANNLLGLPNPLVVGNIAAFDAAVVIDTPAVCADIVGGEPAVAAVVCQCTGPLGAFDVGDQDASGLECTPVQVPVTSTWGSALLAALLLAALSLLGFWRGEARSRS